jgi:hypothetical protein
LPHLLIRHKVAEFEAWKRVFDSHVAAQREAGLHIDKILRNTDDPSEVVLLFEVTNLERARKLVESPGVAVVQAESGVTDEPDILFLD